MVQILLIEDDEVLLKTTASLLERSGYDVLSFRSLKEATTLFFDSPSTVEKAAPKIEIVLLDLSTGDFLPPEKMLDWVNLLFPRRSVDRSPKVGLISGSLDLERIAAQFQADFFVEKPFHPKELRKKLEDLAKTTP